MTKEDAIKFMREHFSEDVVCDIVNAIAEHEREECAKICDEQAKGAYWEGADVCAWAIRERGKE